METEHKLNVILLGRKAWGAKALEYLLEMGHSVTAAVGPQTFKDLDHEEGSILASAQEHGIKVLTVNELYGDIYNGEFQDTDLVISYLFWQKVREPLLTLPKMASINFHPAPLPDYKGLGGYNQAILDGRSIYGVTAHMMSKKIDDGDVIKKVEFHMDPEKETALSLERKSQVIMFGLFKEIIGQISAGRALETEKQQHAYGRYINREMFEKMKYIEKDDDTEVINRKIRAFWYPPYEGAKITIGNEDYTLVNKELLKELGKMMHYKPKD
ncbi:formyltransferase family protein [Thalassobacillus pellis]|uniref:formyltransferase family protein n=1 Tax=Thalassobacillus pellis TaxID=748008 RepID=UPI0019604FFD|nr:formyltransferase family protein [Thalassobacillus pellis]MBM7552591.1 methionyl-tRNA formyltransferase [Thalassobacillus pellis]